MAKVTQAAKVGAFVVGSAILFVIVYRTVSKEVGHGGGYVVHASLKDATGLASHSRVAESVIVLTPGTPDHRKLKDGDEITIVVEAASTDQIMSDVARIADRVK